MDDRSTNKCLVAFTLLVAIAVCSHSSASQTDSLTPKSIVEAMVARYANASSYQDTGIVQDEGKDRSELVLKFKTYFVRPQLFRFEWIDRSVATSEERLNIVWSDGKQTYSHYSWADTEVEKKEDLSLGIAGATGVSRGSAHLIPAMLMEEVGGFRVSETSNLSLLGEEKFEGEDCYILRGYHPQNFPIDMWIGKRDFLLRKTKEPHDDGTYDVDIRRNIKLDEKIPAEVFNYKPPPPPPKAKSRRGVCGLAFVLLTAVLVVGGIRLERRWE